MDRERYRLEALLTLRRAEEDVARQALAEAERALEAAREREAEAAAEVERREQLRRQADARPAGGTAADLAMARRWSERCARELEEARGAREIAAGEVARCREAAERARDALRDRVREREAIERHRAEWELEMRREADRRAEVVLDEAAAAAHARKGQEDR